VVVVMQGRGEDLPASVESQPPGVIGQVGGLGRGQEPGEVAPEGVVHHVHVHQIDRARGGGVLPRQEDLRCGCFGHGVLQVVLQLSAPASRGIDV
jgi:hypothetical protein